MPFTDSFSNPINNADLDGAAANSALTTGLAGIRSGDASLGGFSVQ